MENCWHPVSDWYKWSGIRSYPISLLPSTWSYYWLIGRHASQLCGLACDLYSVAHLSLTDCQASFQIHRYNWLAFITNLPEW